MVPALLLTLAAPRITPESIERAASYVERTRGLSFLVMQDGKVIAERYFNGHSATTPHGLASGTKSFNGVIAMAAQEDGLLRLDELASDTLTEWRSDPRKAKITIRHLLTLTSGLQVGEAGNAPRYARAIQLPAIYDPGTRFEYGPTAFQAFGALMNRKLASRGEDVYRYARRRLLDPLGIKVAFWAGQFRGEPHLPGGASMTTPEWAKWGQFVLEGGKGIVKRESLRHCFVGTRANPGYGLTWWLNKPGTVPSSEQNVGTFSENGQFWPKGPQDVVLAAGKGKQRLYVVPSLRAVVVRQGEQSRFSDAVFLDLLTNM